MSRICLRTICISRAPQAKVTRVIRELHTSTPCQLTAVLTPSVHDTSASTSRRDPTEARRWAKLEELKTNLQLENIGRHRVWSSYLDVLNFLRPAQVPLHVHQAVLRRCTTSLDVARYNLAVRIQKREVILPSHSHETRFRRIIYNMRRAGHAPQPEDYHFILQHFAAVGHHIGALQVLDEMSQVGLQRTTEAYRLCLEAFARRITLPCWRDDRAKLATAISKLAARVLSEMQRNNVEMTGETVELCFRILGQGLQDEPFEKLMRRAYGVDLSYPDRPPLEFWSKQPTISADGAPLRASAPFPFTTPALNNTIDFLGRKRRISKLVQAFEVLTTPVPTQASSPIGSSYVDEEDDDFGYDHPEVAPFTPPRAQPNTETYTRLIRWLSKANHAPLARHYLYQVYVLDRKADWALRRTLSKPDGLLQDFEIPRCRLSTKMINSVFGLTHRQKKLPMMRWLLHILRKTKNARRSEILFYRNLEKWRPAAPEEELDDASNAQEARTPEDQATIDQKLSDLGIHLLLIRREYSRLLLLERRLVDVLGRQTQRVKERLGRRVWTQKDIYIRSQTERVLVSKEQWRQIVQYRLTRRTLPDDPNDEPALGLPNPHSPIFITPQVGFFTPSTARQTRLEAPPQANDA